MKKEKELLADLKRIKKQRKELKLEMKAIQKKLKKIEKQKQTAEGIDPALIEFYSYKIPSNNNEDYMSWCISEKGLEIFNELVDTSDKFDRYNNYKFYDSIYNYIEEYIEIETENVRSEIIKDFLNHKLKDFSSLSSEEEKLVKKIMKCIYCISSNKFKYDW